jgi:hypothetical protein
VGVATRARELSSLPRVDYEDSCLVETPRARERTAEGWAREMLEGASAATRIRLKSVWFALGLKLGAEQGVLGWELSRVSDDLVILAAEARLGFSAEVVIERRPGALFGATFLQQHNPLARLVWARVAPGHRQELRQLIAGAVRRTA